LRWQRKSCDARSVASSELRLTKFFNGPLIFSGHLAHAHCKVPPDFANPLAKQVARIWQVPFAIEIPPPLETSDLNPSGICAADCRLTRMALPRPPTCGRARCRLPIASRLLLPGFLPCASFISLLGSSSSSSSCLQRILYLIC